MKVSMLLESMNLKIKPVSRSDNEELLNFCDFYNDSDQLSWTLTPRRLLTKIGSRGRLFALYAGDKIVGTIGLKESDISTDALEIGYIMINEDHRSLANVMKLYKALLSKLKKSSMVYATTNKNNPTINKLMEFSNKFEKIALIRSNFSTNQLFVWLSTVSGDFDTNKATLQHDYGKYLIRLY